MPTAPPTASHSGWSRFEGSRASALASRLAPLPTAPVLAGGLIAGYAVARVTGSRPLGGVVLLGFGLTCLGAWLRRDGRRVSAALTAGAIGAFAVSHVLAHAIGAWPSVLVCAAAAGAAAHRLSDARRGRANAAVAAA